MTRPEDPIPSIESLQERIESAKSRAQDEHDAPVSGYRHLQKAAQLASGLAAGAAVGGLLGYGLDRWLAISPFGLITGFFLGFAAGLYNLIRQAEKE